MMNVEIDNSVVYEVGQTLNPTMSTWGMDFGAILDQPQLEATLEREFITQEPWGPDIVTNNSLHKYLPVPNNTGNYNPFKKHSEGLEIRARPNPNSPGKYQSGVISTQSNPALHLNKDEYVYVDMKPPKGKGLWAAFWLLPAFTLGDWPDDYSDMVLPEIDPAEFPNVAVDSNSTYYTNLHTYNEPAPDKATSTLSSNEVKHVCPDTFDFYNTYYTFGCLRTTNWVYLTLNHKIINKIPMFKEGIMTGPWMMLFNLAVGGNWPGSPDITTQFDVGLVIRSIKMGKFQFGLPVIDSGNPAGGNRDLIVKLDQYEKELKAKQCASISECFNKWRDELR